jgi:hypothetical protein
MKLGKQGFEDPVPEFTPDQLEEIRQQVQEGIADIDRGEFTDYVGRAAIRRLAEDVKSRGRERLMSKTQT